MKTYGVRQFSRWTTTPHGYYVTENGRPLDGWPTPQLYDDAVALAERLNAEASHE